MLLKKRLLCDLELLLNGSFAPLTGFLNQDDYESVVHTMRLANGSIWPIPIVLPVTNPESFRVGEEIILYDEYSYPIATLTIQSIYKPDLELESQQVLGARLDENHPYGDEMLSWGTNVHYLGGPVKRLQYPLWLDFRELRKTPEETRALFQKRGWTKIVGFQTRNPMHNCHVALTQQAMKQTDANLFIHPIVGVTQECDIDYVTRIKCYKHILSQYPPDKVELAILPLSMRMAGPREAVWHALIRKNYGCTHFIIGRDHAGPSNRVYYEPYAAQELALSLDLGIEIVTSSLIFYNKVLRTYTTEKPQEGEMGTISGTELRRRLRSGEEIPDWFSHPQVIAELRRAQQPKTGFCVYIIGLSASGKSTLAIALKQVLQEQYNRPVTVLDGDVVRTHLSKGLGFSRADRSANVRRIGYVASEIVKHGGIVICANIAPYEDDRQYNRTLISSMGQYIQVFMNIPLRICETRDVKGLYAKARNQEIKEFTGISDPFETPTSNELIIDETQTPTEACLRILELLK